MAPLDAPTRTTLERLLPEAKAEMARGGTLPYAMMGDRGLHRAERAIFFERQWQAVCYAADLAEPGARRVALLGGVPIVVLRDRDGAIRGFVNVCRHRAYPVATEDGTGTMLTCRYHSWSYGLDGCLLRAPGTESMAEFDKARMGLIPISVALWRGIVFAHAAPDAPALTEANPALDTFGDEAGFDLTGYRPLHTFSLEMPCDWKLLQDNIVECYHCPSMHPQSLSRMYRTDGFEQARWDGRVRYATAAMAGGNGRHDCIQMFAGTFLVRDPVIGIVGRLTPLTPQATRVEFRFAAAPGASQADVTRYTEGWAETLGEDRQILSGQAAGVASGRLAAGMLVPGQETCLSRVQALILAGYEDALAAGPH